MEPTPKTTAGCYGGKEETARHWNILRDSEGLGEALKDPEGFYVSENILRRLGGGFWEGGGAGYG